MEQASVCSEEMSYVETSLEIALNSFISLHGSLASIGKNGFRFVGKPVESFYSKFVESCVKMNCDGVLYFEI